MIIVPRSYKVFQEHQKKKYEQSYDRLFEGEELAANNAEDDNDSDDFM